MWLILAFVSATFLGFYDTSKKASLKDNAVLPVLLLNTIFSTIIFSPFLLDYLGDFGWFSHISWLDPSTVFIDSQTLTQNACCTDAAGISQKGVIISSLSDSHSILQAHLMVILKAFIVLSSWICGYFGLKHLPLTIVGPINATRPVIVLLGAVFLFGERLNLCQWTGVILSLMSIFLMSKAGKKEDIDFRSNRWIWCVAELVQFLPDDHYDRNLCLPVVSETPSDHSFPMDLGHSAHIDIHLHRGFRIFHFPQRPWLYDFRRFPGTPKFGDNIIHLRSHNLQGKEHKGQDSRSGTYSAGNGIHLDGVQIG